MTDSFLSVGIDIGTTTTSVVLSRLSIDNASALNQAPRIQIREKQVVYESDIHLTPLTADGIVDAVAVSRIVRSEYAKAAVTPSEILAGAVIITGETARLRNAQQVAHALASLAGEFVVASAGPNLESILAAQGSGAVEHSRTSGKTICNLDIGGGTLNAAVICAGTIVDTACLAVGGRFLVLSKGAVVEKITELGRRFLDCAQLSCRSGQTLTAQELCQISARAAEQVVHFIRGDCGQIAALMLTAPLRHEHAIDQYWITGGIGTLMQSLAAQSQTQLSQWTVEQLTPYGDAGLPFAAALKERMDQLGLDVHVPSGAIRSTVIGAGMHSVQLTGCTIELSDIVLPLRNIPLVNLNWSANEMQLSLERNDIDWRNSPVALFVELPQAAGYAQLKHTASLLATIFTELKMCVPHIVLVRHDVAAALGLLLRDALKHSELLVLDGVEPGAGDYIDIGKPISAHGLGTAATALPVVVKSLIFRT